MKKKRKDGKVTAKGLVDRLNKRYSKLKWKPVLSERRILEVTAAGLFVSNKEDGVNYFDPVSYDPSTYTGINPNANYVDPNVNLDGIGEIAEHCDKTVKTINRWEEKDPDCPIERLHKKGRALSCQNSMGHYAELRKEKSRKIKLNNLKKKGERWTDPSPGSP